MNQPTGQAIGLRPDAFGRLELAVRSKLEGRLHGDYQGLLPGHGSELGEARNYRPGDDVRRIDWAVTARTTETHVRDTIADHELTTIGIIDLSGSLHFGTGRRLKRDVAIEILGAMGFVTAHGANRFGVLAVHPAGEKWLAPASGRHHVHATLRRLAQMPRANAADDGRAAGIDLARGLARANRLARRRGLMVVISDFLGPSTWSKPMRALADRHEVMAIDVVDPRELTLPDVGFMTVADPETGRRRVVDTSDAGLRARYRAAAAGQRARIADEIRRTGADHLTVRTDRDWLSDLIRHIEVRRRSRMTRSGGVR
ncbi:DUF58 domain-containing protein [Euzebya tangerina]|uniref:DUF58 domain-containing protein n=1 Tax=Euzebya tangerina TaxID=591198 RepID=UPI000E31028D|nr:DUF58 domain-containing protein [Euzebya tangerina]